MEALKRRIFAAGIIPVVKLNDPKDAVPLAKALKCGGLPVAEITFRTKAALEAIRRIREECPDILLGAGTITTSEQVSEAVKAGASFLVAPGLNRAVVEQAQSMGIPIIPGVSSATEIEAAMALGLSVLKFFPAEQMGGIATIKALCAPYQNILFIPTGGISEQNVAEYLAYPKVLACGGSWMAKESLINAGDFDGIAQLARSAINQVFGFSLAHVGVNCPDDLQAHTLAKMFETLFGFRTVEKNASVFAGSGIECMKKPYLGEKGHIAISVNNIERAVTFFENNGIEFRMDLIKRDENGKYGAVYLKEEVGGFAIHLVQKK